MSLGRRASRGGEEERTSRGRMQVGYADMRRIWDSEERCDKANGW